MKPSIDAKPVQGEGDDEADRKNTESARAFVLSGKVAEVARDAEPGPPAGKAEFDHAERVGIAHPKGEDPALQHAAAHPARKP